MREWPNLPVTGDSLIDRPNEKKTREMWNKDKIPNFVSQFFFKVADKYVPFASVSIENIYGRSDLNASINRSRDTLESDQTHFLKFRNDANRVSLKKLYV